eukprot:CAMPEP_0184383032 /NCGR_PEP_ID=MMETSP0007-20130409/6813_1 /TAXON_ID=97485 /ORGANISM="Prymnesium parvum, Strain Texoma1" /LENGTH=47 /DNA_ID= /DNA_START= /DNA_END= /DNA_ORIENTATION=
MSAESVSPATSARASSIGVSSSCPCSANGAASQLSSSGVAPPPEKLT